jgi:hypothetical protein
MRHGGYVGSPASSLFAGVSGASALRAVDRTSLKEPGTRGCLHSGHVSLRRRSFAEQLRQTAYPPLTMFIRSGLTAR